MIIAGADEAGRGPLAGPVVAAAVILGTETLNGLGDSKRLTAKRRAELETQIRALCLVGVGEASVDEIDSLNILQATFLAMERAVAALAVPPDKVLVDGNRLPNWAYPSEAIIGGDALIPAISAASIIAKEVRDKMMVAADDDFPGYGWAQNKGYGTKAHVEGIRKLGLTPLHRRLFVRKIMRV